MKIIIFCFSTICSFLISHTGLPTYYIPKEDKEILLQVGVCEAGGEDVESIARVMQTVINRVFYDKYFPNTITEVIHQKGQFSTAPILDNAVITEEAYQALDDVIYGEYKDFDALFFESLEGRIWENKYHYIDSYGGHDFYTIRE